MAKISNGSYKKLGKNIGLLTLGNFASKLLNYFLVPLYTSRLSTEQYGVADLITTTIALLIPIISLQVSDAMMRFLLDKDESKSNETILGSSFFVLFVGLVIATVISPTFLLFNDVSKFYWYFLCLLYADIIYTFIGQFIKGIEKIAVYSIGGVINTFVVAIANIVLLVVFEAGVEGYLLAYILGYVCSIIYMLLASRSFVSRGWIKRKDNTVVKQLLFYSIPLVLNAMCWWINNSSDKYLVSYFCGTSQVGIYAISYKIPSLLATIMTIFFSAWQISAVEDFGSEKSRSFYSDIFTKTLLINTVASLLLISSTKYLAKILFANDFYIAWKTTIPLIVAFYFNTLASFVGTIYTSAKKTNMLLITSVVSAIINIILNIILIPRMGIFGAAVATITCYVVVFIIRSLDSKRLLHLRVNKLLYIACIVAVTIAAVINYIDIKHVMLFNIPVLFVFIILSFASFGELVKRMLNRR